MRKLRIHDAATLEASEAAVWYERERPGLGAEFERAIDRALDVLEQGVVPLTTMPGATGKRGAKRLFLKRFPYAVIVREYPTEILVVAFAHFAKRPGYWLGRLGSSIPRGKASL